MIMGWGRLTQVIEAVKRRPIAKLYNPENVFDNSRDGGGGAGNVWANGYEIGQKNTEELMDKVDREADGSDNLEVCRAVHTTLTLGIQLAAFDWRWHGKWLGLLSVGGPK